MVPAKAAGTAARWAATCRICRVASHSLTTSEESSAATNSRVSTWASIARSVGRRGSPRRPLAPALRLREWTQGAPRMTDTALAANDQNLVWIDLEMTGLLPDRDRIIEIAVVVTDPALM